MDALITKSMESIASIDCELYEWSYKLVMEILSFIEI